MDAEKREALASDILNMNVREALEALVGPEFVGGIVHKGPDCSLTLDLPGGPYTLTCGIDGVTSADMLFWRMLHKISGDALTLEDDVARVHAFEQACDKDD